MFTETEEVVGFIRGLVRPIITFLVIAALVSILVYLVTKFADAEMAKTVVVAFLTLVTAITAFWFGSRRPGAG